MRAVIFAWAWAGSAGIVAAPAASSFAPANWDAGLKLVEARDTNPDPKVVEIELTSRIAEVEVAPGRRVQAWTYDGGIPGPLIRARVGDRVIVHFTNDLPHPTTIHWHGVRVPIEMDGVPGAARGQAGQHVHLRFRRARCGSLLVSPARYVGRTGRVRPLRRLARRGPGRRHRRGGPAHTRPQRHRLRFERRARVARKRRVGGHGVRP